MTTSSKPEWTLPQYMELMDERFKAIEKARELQAKEYERRLDGLNHEHARIAALADTYVSSEKYEDRIAAEALARTTAVESVNEKFQEFLKRYEQEKVSVAKALTLAEGKDKRSAQLQPWQLWIAGAALTMVVLIVNVGILFLAV